MSDQLPQKPVREFRASGGGTVTAAVWRNEHERDGQLMVTYSIGLRKRYYDRDSETWKDSDYFFPEDLPKLRLVIDKAYEYAVLRERDPQGGTPRETATQPDAEAPGRPQAE